MKTVFTNSEIFHVFNEQKQNEGKTSNRNIFFENNKIYSYGYHYLLGEFIDENTIVINDSGYSRTTGTHISILINATRDKKQFFSEQVDPKKALINLEMWFKQFPRATKYKDYYLSRIDDTFKRYFEFIEYTKKETSILNKENHEKIVDLKDSFYNNFENLEQEIKEQQKRQKEKDKQAIKENLIKWKSNEINYFKNNTGKDFLRLNSENIETSQGVKIPIIEAKRLLKLIDTKNIIGQRVDERFVVRSFDSILKVGCHNIDINEINYIKNLI
jgi:hypothetical protein